MLMCIQNLVRFCQSVLKILSGNKILTAIKGCNSVKILRKTTGNNPKLELVELVNVDVHTKFGQILSIRSQYIERKRNSDVNQGQLLRQRFAKNDGNNPKLELVNVGVHTKFGQILSIRFQDIEWKRKFDVNQGP